jgi:hypothetical protein
MEVADPTGSAAVGSRLAVDPALTNGEDPFGNNSVGDDDRSSSLSEIDDTLDHEDDSPVSHKLAAEIDSEAETERIDESPNIVRTRKDIVLSAGGYENSPSKLAQSTTYDEMDVDEETPATEDSPSKPPRSTKSNGITALTKESTPNDADDKSPVSLESAGTKRKRSEAGDDSGTVSGDEDRPARKRRGSTTSNVPGDEGIDEGADEATIPADAADDLPEVNEPSNDGTPAAEEPQDNEARPVPSKGRKGKKGKRKGKKTKEIDEDQETGLNRDSRAATIEQGPDEGEADEAGEAGNNAKAEEECEYPMFCLPFSVRM